MATAELTPGVITGILARLGVEAEARAAIALTPLALVVERQAKINASNGQHAYGTRTPSSGDPTGPARISGTLVRAITHSEPQNTGFGWEVLVGMAPGLYPFYNRRTSASQYAYYLEVTGVRNGRRFPFLEPALNFATHIAVHAVFEQVFGMPWPV